MISMVVCLSGGMDSATLLGLAKTCEVDQIIAVSFNYGQRHYKEIQAAKAIAEHYKTPHIVFDLRPAFSEFNVGSSLTDPSVNVPEGHYAAESMKATIVPNRNMIFLSFAAALAIQRGFGFVGYAAHAGDHAIYPDCRPDFTVALGAALHYASDLSPRITLWTPFLYATKAEIASRGSRLEVPYGLTWSCYKGGTQHCGRCGTCVERKEAFTKNGVVDPTEYEFSDGAV